MGAAVWDFYQTASTYSGPQSGHGTYSCGTQVATVLLAGFSAGSLHASGTSVYDAIRMSVAGGKLVRPAVSFGGVLHHSVGHSVLFGSFEAVKIGLGLAHASLSEEREGPARHGGEGEDTQDLVQVRLRHVLGVGVAGGLAGQAQHLVAHYTELLEAGSATARECASSPVSTVRNLASVPPPSVRSVLLAFPPSAVAFLAFEFGKDLE